MTTSDPTPEAILDKLQIVRILYGDLPQSVFYPILSDMELEALLRLEKWNEKRAAKRAAIAAAFYLTGISTRERAGDIEAWNSVAIEYKKVLDAFLRESDSATLPDDIIPYAAGISASDVNASNSDPDKNRSPLSQVTPCFAWWTRVRNYEMCCNDNILKILNRN